MKEQFFKIISDIPQSPIIFVVLLFGFFTLCASFRLVREFSDAMETLGFKISTKDRKKWRKLFSTILGTIFIVFVFLHLYASLFRY